MLARDILATINSDDPSYFGGYLADNFEAVQRALGLTGEELATLARNSISASFLDQAARDSLLAELEAVAPRNRGTTAPVPNPPTR